MSLQETLTNIFVSETQIPEAFRLTAELHQGEYLCNGQMKPWYVAHMHTNSQWPGT